MPSSSKSTKRSSRSPARRKSRSRSRSRGRSKSPSRTKTNASPSTKGRPSRSRTPTREKKTPTTPVRQSARIAKQVLKKETPPEIVNEAIPKVTRPQATKAKKEEIEEILNKMTKNTTSKYEFGGPLGALALMLHLPVMVLVAIQLCNKDSCDVYKLPAVLKNLIKLDTWKSLLSLEAACIYFGWLSFHVLFSLLPVGKIAEGQEVNGKRLKYRCNGLYSFIAGIMLFTGLWKLGYPVTKPADLFIQLAASGIFFSTLLSVYLYIRARKADQKELSPSGNTDSGLYNFFIGQELNPRIGSFDLKFFCELRPGMIGWVMFNAVFLLSSWQNGKIPLELLFVAAAQALYVADSLLFEDANLTMMDMTHEGFGWMLAFGDLVMVPFMYCLQTRYLLMHPQNLSVWSCALAMVLFVVGYIIFRGSNSQKNTFRNNPYDPALAHLESIPTASGKRLLVTGWWGMCRHPNYFGDLLMALSWGLACGFNSIIPYCYFFDLLLLLVHRQRRDDAICSDKYQFAWDRYCQRVPYRIIPYVY